MTDPTPTPVEEAPTTVAEAARRVLRDSRPTHDAPIHPGVTPGREPNRVAAAET